MKLIRLTLDAVINAEDITSMEVYKSSFRENTYKVSVNLRELKIMVNSKTLPKNLKGLN